MKKGGRCSRGIPSIAARTASVPGRWAVAAILSILLAAAGSGVHASGPGCAGETLRGTVTYVFDGDTIRVRLDGGGTTRVRLIGVDCPELDDDREAVRFLAFIAGRFTQTRLSRQDVSLVLGPERQDAFGRLLAFVELEGGAVFNEVLVRQGFAWAALKYPFDEHWKQRLKAAEEEARRAERGLWRQEPYPIIEAAEARSHLGEIITVRFRCGRAFERSRLRLYADDNAPFEMVVPLSVLKTLPGSLDLKGRIVEVTGLVELFRGHPQIMVGVPLQLRRVDGPGGTGPGGAPPRKE